MAKFSLFILLIVAITCDRCAQAFVMPNYAHLMGADYDYDYEPPAAPTPTPNYVMRIQHPSERVDVVPETDEITKVIVAPDAGENKQHNQLSEEANTINASKEEANSKTSTRQSKTLTYTDLDKLLAHWHLEKERNAYEMQSSNRHRNTALKKLIH